jgi:hypothetical protein
MQQKTMVPSSEYRGEGTGREITLEGNHAGTEPLPTLQANVRIEWQQDRDEQRQSCRPGALHPLPAVQQQCEVRGT